MLKKQIALSVFLSATACHSLALNWMPANQLDNVRIASGGDIYGDTVNSMSAAGCTAATKFKVSISHPGFDTIYSALLAAIVAGRDVRLSVSGCVTSGTLDIDGVRINR